MKFDEFKVGQEMAATFSITDSDFRKYIEFARTRNVLHEDPDLAMKEGISGTLVPGRSVLARAEGEMTRLPEFSDCVMLLYGMDGDAKWNGRHTRFLREVYTGEKLSAKYVVSDSKTEREFGILAVDFEVSRVSDGKLVAVSRRNLYRIKRGG